MVGHGSGVGAEVGRGGGWRWRWMVGSWRRVPIHQAVDDERKLALGVEVRTKSGKPDVAAKINLPKLLIHLTFYELHAKN